MRDARKQQGEKKDPQGEPKNGEKSPTNPADRLPNGGKPENPDASSDPQKNPTPPWFASLPPEIRDALAGGRAQDIPARYRKLIQRYTLWLQKHGAGSR